MKINVEGCNWKNKSIKKIIQNKKIAIKRMRIKFDKK